MLLADFADHRSNRWKLFKRSGGRSVAFRILPAISVVVNILAIGMTANIIHGRGGFSYLKAYLTKDSHAVVDVGGTARRQMLDSLPMPTERPVVFLGDSLTAQCEWQELLGRKTTILNRGIGGDTSAGVLERIPGIIKLYPKAVFLMIGTNDASQIGYAPADTIGNYRKILDALVTADPDMLIYAETILPSRVPKFNAWSEKVNNGVARMESKNVKIVNMRPLFLDSKGLLKTQYTFDGLHLSVEGYNAWKDAISPLLQPLM